MSRIVPEGKFVRKGSAHDNRAMDLQAVAFAEANNSNVPPHVKAALMRAWVDLEEIRMALRGQGKPKPVEARNAVVEVSCRLSLSRSSKTSRLLARERQF